MSSACRGCGKEIVWAQDMNTGAKIPLEKIDAYVLTQDGTCCKSPSTYISHFKTCPKANDFSKKNAKPEAQGRLPISDGS